jgi:hypothetical protein
MTVTIRRSKPVTIIKRTSKPPVHPEIQGIINRQPPMDEFSRHGHNWPDQPGWPPDRGRTKYHLIYMRDRDTPFVFLWDARRQEWTVGLHSWSAQVMGAHDYVGECTPIYRTSSQAPDNPMFSSYRRRK